MKKALLFFTFFFTFYAFSQVQIGTQLIGTDANDNLGASVDLSFDGTVLAVGTPQRNVNSISHGSVSVYRFESSDWVRIGDEIFGPNLLSRFGSIVDLSADGNYLIVGAPNSDSNNLIGQVRVYQNVSDSWQQVGNEIDGSNNQANFGHLVRISDDGQIIAVASPGGNTNGSFSGDVKVYELSNNTWVQKGSTLLGDNFADNFGFGMDLSADGTVLSVGAPSANSGMPPGYARVYRFQGGNWNQIGNTISGSTNEFTFGRDVDITANGTNMVLANPMNTNNGNQSGEVNTYEISGNIITNSLNSLNGEILNNFGMNVRLSDDGEILAVSARNRIMQSNVTGVVKIYKKNNTSWEQIGVEVTGVNLEDGYQISLSGNGNILALGSPFYDGTGPINKGRVRTFNLSSILSVIELDTSDFNVSPNPTNNQFTLQLKEGIQFQQAKIYNQLGQLVKVSTTETTTIQELSSGLYFLEVITDQGKAIEKLIIE